MRILHTLPGRNWGGMEHRTLEQVRWLKDHGHDVCLAAPEGASADKARAMGLPFVPMSFDKPFSCGLRRLVKERGIEVIDAHGSRDAKAAILCLDRCAVVRDRHITQPLKPSFGRRLQWSHGCDAVIAVAECVRRGLVEGRLVDPVRTFTVGEWAEDRFFAAGDDKKLRPKTRKELGIKPRAFVVGVVGMLRPDKAQEHLLSALRLLRERGEKVSGLIVGEATAETVEYERNLRSMAEGLDVSFAGYRDEVPAMMAAMDLVVVPSILEAQSRVVPQAFASRRPVIASNIGGLPELVHNGETGKLVPAADPSALAEAIMATKKDGAKLVKQARTFAEEHLRFDTKMIETLYVYQEALRRARNRLTYRAD